MFDYYHRKWKKKQKYTLRLDRYKDRVTAMYSRTERATTVHHIYPAGEYPECTWCDWNLISVSQGSHNELGNRKTGELIVLEGQLMDITVPGKGWGRK